MRKQEFSPTMPEEEIISKIYEIRGLKVMIDRDLAELYGLATKVLKQAVKRNIERFPEDFMFEMTDDEFRNWRSQFVTSNSERMGLRYQPFCFTEQGVTMLSCVLNSKKAIETNIRIIRVFTKMREMLMTHKDILLKLEQFENRIGRNSENIQLIFKALKRFLNPPQEPRRQIGYKRKSEDS
jgi:phage regulator Rha-like protein